MSGLSRRTLFKAIPLFGAAVSMPVLALEHTTADQRRAFHLAQYKRACEELDPMIRNWTDMQADGPRGAGAISFRITGQYEGDGVYESGQANVLGGRTRYQVALRPGDIWEGERTFLVSCPGDKMVLAETRLETFIGQKIS